MSEQTDARMGAVNAPKRNLMGQVLGRKGRDTRERILAATTRLLSSDDEAISMSAVAREASLGMPTLYLYFTDLTELLLAVLEPIMESAQAAYVDLLKTRWQDENLEPHCLAFVEAYYEFWRQHARILHLRNSMADANDTRMRRHRVAGTAPVRDLLLKQMEAQDADKDSQVYASATVAITGVERIITVATDVVYMRTMGEFSEAHAQSLVSAGARMLFLIVQDGRAQARLTKGG